MCRRRPAREVGAIWRPSSRSRTYRSGGPRVSNRRVAKTYGSFSLTIPRNAAMLIRERGGKPVRDVVRTEDEWMICPAVEAAVCALMSLLATPKPVRKRAWCRGCCAATRRVHFAIWRYRPCAEYVEKQVLPLLRRAKTAILRARPNVAENVEVRVLNLAERYCQNKPSAIRPGDFLKVPRRILRRPLVVRLSSPR